MRRTNNNVITFEKTKVLSPVFYIIAYIIPLALQVGFLLFQFKNKIITLWNIFPTALMIGIFVFVIKGSISDYKTSNNTDSSLDETNFNNNKPQKNYRTNSKVISNKSSKKLIFIQILIMVGAFAFSYLFYNIHSNKVQDLTLIDSEIVSQWGETSVETETKHDGSTTSTQRSYVEVTVEYEFDGEKKEAIISGSTTSKVYVKHLKIYINSDGEFVSDYGRILVWKIESIIFFCFAIFILLILIFKLGTETFAASIFMGVSFAVLALFTCQFAENFLYNDISCFVATFANISIYMLLAMTFSAIFGKKIEKDNKSKLNPNYAQTGNLSPNESYVSSNENQQNNESNSELSYNDFLEDPNNSNKNNDDNNLKSHSSNNVCPNCSAPISETDKFCQECGTKL